MDSLAPKSEALLEGVQHFGIKLGLERIREFLAAAGNPQRQLPVVLVAGTNGKGSTASLIAAMARAAGYRTGLFVSPHLEALTERISIDGRPIRDLQLATLLEQLIARAKTLDGDPPTFFESLTLAGTQHFANEAVDLAVFEVGLGGRLDATNVTEPAVSVITTIGFDHQKQLGSTLAAIAAEKAGIARSGRPLIVWGEPAEVNEAFGRTEQEVGCRLIDVATTCHLLPSADEGAFALTTPTRHYDPLRPALAGRHQQRNVAQAVVAAEALADAGWTRLERNAIVRGVESVRWPGRLEHIELPAGQTVLLDAAHNSAGASVLADYLRSRQTKRQQVDMLFGALGDKQVDAMLPPLAALADSLWLTRPPSTRAVDPDSWLPHAGERATVITDWQAALDQVLERTGPDRLLVACGSIYLIGAVRRRLRELFGVPESTI